MNVQKKTLQKELRTIGFVSGIIAIAIAVLWYAQVQHGLMTQWAEQLYRTLL